MSARGVHGIWIVSYPEIFSKLDFRTSSPISMMLRPITFSTNGFTAARAAEGPAIAKINLPAAAMGLAPKTGEEMNVAPFADKASKTEAAVSGCTVDVSTKILPLIEPHDSAAIEVKSFKTWSFEIWGALVKCNSVKPVIVPW